MTNLLKRRWLQAAALTAVSAAVLVGCGKKEEAKPAEAPAAAAKAEPLKIAFAYVGPVGDGGWTFAHDNARKALQAEFGDRSKPRLLKTCLNRRMPSAFCATWWAKATS